MGEIDYHPAPQWLTTEYLEVVLRKYKKDNTLQVIRLDIKPATGKGENYASIMTRIKVDYTLRNSKDIQRGSYLVKTGYESDPYIASIFAPYDVYNTEMRIYEKVLPQLTELLHEIGDNDKLFAETVHVDYARSAIIFEDLSVLDFIVADRLAGMDFTHAKLALKKLAQLHATAAVLNERSPELGLEKFDRGIFNRHTKGFAPFFENMLTVCAEFAGECEELGNYYKEKLLKLKPQLSEHATRVYDRQEGHFHTLSHGDYWVNNVMLSYNNADQKAIKDLVIIDFQFCCWTSPSVDLHYFLNTSLQSRLRLESQDVLVKYYHKALVETLQQLNFKGYVPTLHELWVQLEAGRFYSVTSALIVQPVMINDKTEDAEFMNLISDDERARNFRKLLYSNKKVQETAKALLPILDRRGLLDVDN